MITSIFYASFQKAEYLYSVVGKSLAFIADRTAGWAISRFVHVGLYQCLRQRVPESLNLHPSYRFVDLAVVRQVEDELQKLAMVDEDRQALRRHGLERFRLLYAVLELDRSPGFTGAGGGFRLARRISISLFPYSSARIEIALEGNSTSMCSYRRTESLLLPMRSPTSFWLNFASLLKFARVVCFIFAPPSVLRSL